MVKIEFSTLSMRRVMQLLSGIVISARISGVQMACNRRAGVSNERLNVAARRDVGTSTACDCYIA